MKAGLYSSDTIEEYDEIQVFRGETHSILSTIVKNIAREDKTGKKHKVIAEKLISKESFQRFHGIISKIL